MRPQASNCQFHQHVYGSFCAIEFSVIQLFLQTFIHTQKCCMPCTKKSSPNLLAEMLPLKASNVGEIDYRTPNAAGYFQISIVDRFDSLSTIFTSLESGFRSFFKWVFHSSILGFFEDLSDFHFNLIDEGELLPLGDRDQVPLARQPLLQREVRGGGKFLAILCWLTFWINQPVELFFTNCVKI